MEKKVVHLSISNNKREMTAWETGIRLAKVITGFYPFVSRLMQRITHIHHHHHHLTLYALSLTQLGSCYLGYGPVSEYEAVVTIVLVEQWPVFDAGHFQ